MNNQANNMEEWEEVSVPTHPINGGRWVATVVEIRCNATGEVREYEANEIKMDDEETPSASIWREGNLGCDCNRRPFFVRAEGKEEDWDSELINPCSEGLYSVRLRSKKTGRVFYSEFDEVEVKSGD